MALNDMFADMLKKAIPPEVMAMLTEEKIKSFGAQANQFVTDLRESLARIEAQQATILAKLEGIENERTTGPDRGNRSAGKRGKSASGGDGSAD